MPWRAMAFLLSPRVPCTSIPKGHTFCVATGNIRCETSSWGVEHVFDFPGAVATALHRTAVGAGATSGAYRFSALNEWNRGCCV
uniref:Putative secreted protein n=1 Tax=Anopheles darlingi TaxID=43151 RepID=A0A2M4D6T1_ANODA